VLDGFPFAPGGFSSNSPGFRAAAASFNAASTVFCSFSGVLHSNPGGKSFESLENTFNSCAKIPFALAPKVGEIVPGAGEIVPKVEVIVPEFGTFLPKVAALASRGGGIFSEAAVFSPKVVRFGFVFVPSCQEAYPSATRSFHDGRKGKEGGRGTGKILISAKLKNKEQISEIFLPFLFPIICFLICCFE
jgi:hypothetical protein